MTQFEDVLETILEEYARRDSEGEFDTWEETDAFVKEKAEVLLAYVKEEPVSEELEVAANAYISNENNYSHSRTDTFKAGAQWQKQKDDQYFANKTIETLDNAYENGMQDMREQIMKDAIEREVKVDAGGYPYIPELELYDYDKDVPLAKKGDKYKVVLIKED